MIPECRHKFATAELQWHALLLRCVWCPFEEVRNRCVAVRSDWSRCPAPVEESGYQTCSEHVDQEPPKW